MRVKPTSSQCKQCPRIEGVQMDGHSDTHYQIRAAGQKQTEVNLQSVLPLDRAESMWAETIINVCPDWLFYAWRHKHNGHFDKADLININRAQ